MKRLLSWLLTSDLVCKLDAVQFLSTEQKHYGSCVLILNPYWGKTGLHQAAWSWSKCLDPFGWRAKMKLCCFNSECEDRGLSWDTEILLCLHPCLHLLDGFSQKDKLLKHKNNYSAEKRSTAVLYGWTLFRVQLISLYLVYSTISPNALTHLPSNVCVPQTHPILNPCGVTASTLLGRVSTSCVFMGISVHSSRSTFVSSCTVMLEQEGCIPKLFPHVGSLNLSQISWYAEALTVFSIGTKGLSPAPENNRTPSPLHTSTLQSHEYRSPGNQQTQTH